MINLRNFWNGQFDHYTFAYQDKNDFEGFKSDVLLAINESDMENYQKSYYINTVKAMQEMTDLIAFIDKEVRGL